MHKKLYKGKKNWVIGLIAGAILIFGGVSATAYADTAPFTFVQQENGKVIQDKSQVIQVTLAN